MQFETANQTPELRLGRHRERLTRISQPEQQTVPRPARELQSAKRKGNLVRSGWYARSDSARVAKRKRLYASDSFSRLRQCRLRFVPESEPAVEVARVGGIDLPHPA